MALTFVRRSATPGARLQPLVEAYDELNKNQADLQKQIEALQNRAAAVHAALEAIRPLLPEGHLAAQSPEDGEGEDEANGNLDASNPFAGLSFSQALHKFMLGKEPMSAPGIAREFEEAGWMFKAHQTQSAKVNQVGVTLRRFEGKLFERLPDGSWAASLA